MTTKTSLDDSMFGGTGAKRGPVTFLLDLFSSVRVGIVLLTLLFIYASIGSAGIIYPVRGEGDFRILGINLRHEMLRQWRPFELTEFEWFHTIAFNALILLICVNIAVTTLRRIRFSMVNLGVWMIHSGIITLAIGSYIYFGTKVEGDAPVIRRDVVINVPGAPEARLPALTGAGPIAVTTAEGEYQFQVSSIDPAWELRSEEDLGKAAFSVMVSVRSPKGEFIRQLLAGYPHYTEDVIPGKGRVKKLEEFGGRALVDESIDLGLAPRPQRHFWVKDSAAVYLRSVGEDAWKQHPIEGLPRYNDYISDLRDIWPTQPGRDGETLKPRPLSIPVTNASGVGDASTPLDIRISGFLRYAIMHENFVPAPPGPPGQPASSAEAQVNPVVDLVMTDPNGRERNIRLEAMNPVKNTALDGAMTFDWAETEEQYRALITEQPKTLRLTVPEAGFDESITFTKADEVGREGPYTPMGTTGFSYRITSVVERLPLQNGQKVTLLLLGLKTPEGAVVTRMVREDPALNRDIPFTRDDEPSRTDPPDPRVLTRFDAGRLVAPLQLVAGPGDIGLRLMADDGQGGRKEHRLAADGGAAEFAPGWKISIRRSMTNAIAVTKPLVIPWQQRDKDADASQSYALVRLDISHGGATETRWIPFHRYVFDDQNEAAPSMTRYEPSTFELATGERIEILIGRERRDLPTPVVLDDFILTTHVGGFTGRVSSIRDWTSVVRFIDPASEQPTEAMSVSTNDPVAHAGMWYFQSFWDAPRGSSAQGDPGSGGMAFTGLGVGNRNGVYTQLVGCCISVAGMIYAFYIKPIIRRRRREEVLADIEAGKYGTRARERRRETPVFEETPS